MSLFRWTHRHSAFLLALGLVILQRAYSGSLNWPFVLLLAILLSIGSWRVRPKAVAQPSSRLPALWILQIRYLISCMLFVPTTERWERQCADRHPIIHLDLMEREGAQARERYGVQWVPAFLLLDEAGAVRWQERVPPKAEDLQSVGI